MKVWQKTIALLTSTTLHSFHKTARTDSRDIPRVEWGGIPYARSVMFIKKVELTNLGVAGAFLAPERYYLKWSRLNN